MPQPVAANNDLPPGPNVPKDSEGWDNWFYRLYQMLLEDGGVFPALRVQGKDGTGSFTADKNMFQELLSLDCGLYSDYSSDNGNIIYGFAANVRRSRGNNLTVGAQLNAWGPKEGFGSVFGIATEAHGNDPFTGALIGIETTPISKYNNNTSAKLGMDAVFKDRLDGATSVSVLGSDRYNYYSSAHWISSQARSLTGERCGWTRGVSFIGQCLDEQNPPAWNAVVNYSAGQVVTSGGLAWQAIQSSLNQVPAVPSAYWVQHTPAGTFSGAIGIDFSSVPVSVIARTASAMRLRDGMAIHYDCTGAIGSLFDNVAGVMRVVENAGSLRFGVEVASGELHISRAADAPGGGAAATPATVGGTGPAAAAQAGWINFTHTALGNIWFPYWQ